MDVLGEPFAEQVEVEVEQPSVGVEVVVRKALLVLVQVVVHLPEPALRGRAFGRLRRLLGMGMRGRDGEVPEDESQPLPDALLDVLDDRVRLPTVGTLVVAVFDEGDPSITRPLDVIPVLRHRQGQLGLPLRGPHEATPFIARSSSACRMPSAPGFTPTGDR